jgi:hypothetical protein
MTALVVVDGRDQTPGLELEVKRILRSRLEFKTAFVTEDGKMPPILSRLDARSSHPSEQFLILTPDIALQTVPKIINGAKVPWIPVQIHA